MRAVAGDAIELVVAVAGVCVVALMLLWTLGVKLVLSMSCGRLAPALQLLPGSHVEYRVLSSGLPKLYCTGSPHDLVAHGLVGRVLARKLATHALLLPENLRIDPVQHCSTMIETMTCLPEVMCLQLSCCLLQHNSCCVQ